MTSSSSPRNTPTGADLDRMQELLLGLLRSLVSQPDDLRLEAHTGETGITFRLFVSPEDLGKVIGKQGRTARALRTILSAIASKSNQRFALEVLEIK